ncbi:MAG: hypothetical protein ACLR76_11525 [Alistipes sp.]
MVANPEEPHSMQALPVMSWIAGLQYTLGPMARYGRLQWREGFRRA